MSFYNEVTYYWMSGFLLFQFKLNSISTNIIITNHVLLQNEWGTSDSWQHETYSDMYCMFL